MFPGGMIATNPSIAKIFNDGRRRTTLPLRIGKTGEKQFFDWIVFAYWIRSDAPAFDDRPLLKSFP